MFVLTLGNNNYVVWVQIPETQRYVAIEKESNNYFFSNLKIQIKFKHMADYKYSKASFIQKVDCWILTIQLDLGASEQDYQAEEVKRRFFF